VKILRHISPRRVLMTADTVGGVWNFALELCKGLQPFDVEVVLATLGNPMTVYQRRAVAALPNVQVKESTYKLEWMDEPWEDVVESGTWLLELEAESRPDLVHLNGYAHGALPWRAPVLVAGHSCVCSWFEAVRGHEAPGETWGRYRQEASAGLRSAAVVTTPTRAMMNALHRHYGRFTAGPAIYNGRRASEYLPGIKEPFIMAAGRLWDEAKNVLTLDGIAPALPWPVYIAGEDRHPDSGGRAPFKGATMLGRLAPDVLAQWLGRASIYVLPARYEPFGLSALEAALAGCALVLGDIASLREVWGDAAIYVPPDNSRVLQSTLERLVADKAERDLLAQKARARALTYTPERMAEGYVNLYRSMLAAREMQDVVSGVVKYEGREELESRGDGASSTIIPV
jgi:glycogen synthase